MFVALMPFSTDLVGDFSGQITAEVLFAGNLLLLGLLFLARLPGARLCGKKPVVQGMHLVISGSYGRR